MINVELTKIKYNFNIEQNYCSAMTNFLGEKNNIYKRKILAPTTVLGEILWAVSGD